MKIEDFLIKILEKRMWILFCTSLIATFFFLFTYEKKVDNSNRVGNDVGGMVEVK